MLLLPVKKRRTMRLQCYRLLKPFFTWLWHPNEILVEYRDFSIWKYALLFFHVVLVMHSYWRLPQPWKTPCYKDNAMHQPLYFLSLLSLICTVYHLIYVLANILGRINSIKRRKHLKLCTKFVRSQDGCPCCETWANDFTLFLFSITRNALVRFLPDFAQQ